MPEIATRKRKSKLTDCVWAVLAFVVVIWLVRVCDLVLKADLNQYGIHPRSLDGLVGIVASPFLHDGFAHLLSNTVPLFILLLLLFMTQTKPWRSILWIVLLSGVLLWLVGRSSIHIGASSLIFGLITYLIASGIWNRRVSGAMAAAVVLLLYGGSLVWGVLPRFGSPVSWEGHLCGALVGVGVAWLNYRREKNSAGTTGFELKKIASDARATEDL